MYTHEVTYIHTHPEFGEIKSSYKTSQDAVSIHAAKLSSDPEVLSFTITSLVVSHTKEIEKEQTIYKGSDPELLKKYQSGDFNVYWEHPRGGMIPPWKAPICNARVSHGSYIFTVKKRC